MTHPPTGPIENALKHVSYDNLVVHASQVHSDTLRLRCQILELAPARDTVRDNEIIGTVSSLLYALSSFPHLPTYWLIPNTPHTGRITRRRRI